MGAAEAVTAAVLLISGAVGPSTLQVKDVGQPQAIVAQEDSPGMAWEGNL